MSNISGTSVIGPSSLVNYFHKTEKDFLESEEIWEKLISKTEGTGFNHSVALMRSCVWHINPQIAFSVELSGDCIDEYIEAASKVAAFMTYAVQADPDARSRDMQTTLIDQLNDLLCKYNICGYWLSFLVPYRGVRYNLLDTCGTQRLPEGQIRKLARVASQIDSYFTTPIRPK